MRRPFGKARLVVMSAATVVVAAATVAAVVWRPAAVAVLRDSPPPLTTAHYAAGWQNHPVKVTLTAVDQSGLGIDRTQYRVDKAPDWSDGTSLTIAAPANHSGDGVHTVFFRSIDNGGVVEPTRTCQVEIDTRPPLFLWGSLYPRQHLRVGVQWLHYHVEDVGQRVTIAYTVSDAWGRLVTSVHGLRSGLGTHALRWSARYQDGVPVMPGLYRLRATIVDEAGNRTVSSPALCRDQHPVRAQAWFRLPRAGRHVALTFDDGNFAGAWRQILSTLVAYRVKATFFPLGSSVRSHADVARLTVQLGMAVGSHSWNHPLMTGLNAAGQRWQLQRTEQVWWSALRASTLPYFRPPYGAYDRTTLAVAGALGYQRVIVWDVDPRDWSDPGVTAITQRVLSHARPGSIILMHLKPETAAALPAILRGLRARRLQPVTLPQLFQLAGYR
jgi:peptidoglycan/xylan/chitin deacetylase (PgdA/CDA1 family)